MALSKIAKSELFENTAYKQSRVSGLFFLEVCFICFANTPRPVSIHIFGKEMENDDECFFLLPVELFNATRALGEICSALSNYN